jgi:hypothetical protein
MQIDRRDEHHAKAETPTIETLETDSNAIYERLLQRLKHPSGIVSIDEGMQINPSERHPAESETGVRIKDRITEPTTETEPLGNSHRSVCE